MPRKREYIRMPDRLAAALALLLPQDQRDDLRSRKVKAEQVIRLFEMDHHPILHAFGGPGLWWNLEPKLKRPHREKSAQDTSIVAKVKRLKAAHTVLAGVPKAATNHQVRPYLTEKRTRKIAKRANPWPARGARKIPSRKFSPV
jgi:hypothetical protein